MEKENSASSGGGGGENTATVTGGGATSASEKLQADQANPLLDPSALFGAYWPRGDSAASSIFGGMPGGYGLSAHHLPSAYAILGRGGTAPGFGGHTPTSAPPPPPPYTHGSLGTLSVAASQAASLGINPASAAWWTMASHLAAQDYLARIQGAAGLPGFPPGAESLLPPYPASLLNPPSHSSHKSTKSSKSHKTSASSSNSGPPSSHTGSLAVSQAPITSSTHHSTSASSSCNTPTSQSQNVVSTSPPKEGSDPSSILGGVRLPPDTEIIKYTSSIVGPKIPGTTNRGRKKTISLDSPNVSVHAPPIQTMSAHQTNTTTTSMMIEPRKYNRTSGLQSEVNDYRESIDRVEVIKLPAHSTNGSVLSAPPIYTTCNTTNANINANDSDAPLNLSLKPASTSSNSPIPGSQPLSQLSNLSHSLLASDRTSRRKPGPKPRRVPQNSVAVPASPSPSLAQLFAAADSPQRPSSGSEESESTTTHHKDGRPRNLGRGVSKPKKNTVASLLAQSRALGIKPTPTLDPNAPLSHQVSLLRSNILAAQLHASATGQIDEKNQRSLQEKMKNKLLEASGEESNMDVTSESGSNTDVVTDTDEDNAEGTPSAKRRKLNPSEKDLQVPLERGWKRETVIKGLGKTGVIKGDVSYYSPCGKTFRSSPDLLKFLEQQNPAELTTANFSFSSRSLVGEFLQPTMGFAEAEFVRLGSQEVARRLDELRAAGGFRDARPNNQYERDKLAYAKKLAKEEAQRHKEQARLIKEQEKTERQEAVRRERELRNQQLLEGRKRLAFTIKQKMKIIQEIERGKSKSDVARELGLASSTVATIWKNRVSIAESWRNRDIMQTPESMGAPEAGGEVPGAAIPGQQNVKKSSLPTGLPVNAIGTNVAPSLVPPIVPLVTPTIVTITLPTPPSASPPSNVANSSGGTAGQISSSGPKPNSNLPVDASVNANAVAVAVAANPPINLANINAILPSQEQEQLLVENNIQQAQTQTQNQELLEARKKRQEEVEKIRMEEQQRKQQERELKRQQAVMLKEQMYMQELSKQREMLYTVELERERRRQHMALVRALENRRKMEERERKRLEARAERIANKEKRAEQRKMELELVEQIRKPVEDMELTDHRPLPKIKRLPGLKLSGQAFSDIVMVFEFLHNFGETLGFDMESLPSLKSLQLALLNDEEAEEEMLSVMTHLLVCAIEDPGIPQPARHTTGLGQSLRQADITHANISEVLRIYLYANATGEVKALTGVCLERERDKRFADHHQNGGDYQSTGSGKNAQFYEHLHNNETWKMSERLRDKPFLALNPTHKAQMLAFLCNELLQNKAVIRQIEGSLENVAQLKKERFILDMKIRKLRQLHSRKVRMEAVGVIINKTGDTITIDKKEGEEGSEGTNAAPTATVGTTPTPDESNTHDETHDETEDMSENESEGTQPEEEEDKNLSGEELGKKLDKLLKQSEEQLQKLNQSSKSLRAHVFGQDRYWRRYWELPCAGGIFIEAMESAEPEILALQAELDEKWKGREIEKETENAEMIKAEDKVENKIDTENRENEAPNEVKQSNKFNEKENTDEVKAEDKQKIDHDEMNCKKSLQNSLNDETTTKSPKIDIKTENNDNSMSDAKTNVTSDEIKQETEIVPMEVDPKVEENVKKEHSEHSLKCETPKIVVKLMEDKIIETMPNGDKFNHINNSHNPKEINGTFMTAENTEPHWFSILPRETCDTPGPSTKQIFGIAEPTELRIPIFPPPASPNYDRCDSPAPLILTQEEAVQLEYLKIHGLPPPGEAKPVPKDYRHGWWRITDVDTFQELLEHLHSRGVREKELKRTTWATMESFLAVTGKIHVDPGNVAATELAAMSTDDAESTGIPSLDLPEDWSEQVALRVDAQLLEQVEALEDKVANASMQVKGWKLPPRAGTEEADEIEKLNEMEQVNAVEQARQRLLSLEAAIERRYLKPPLGICTGDPNLAALKAEQAAAANASLNSSDQGGSSLPPQEETTPRGLNNWREATARAHTSAQLAMALYMLEASIAWDKSIMKANCQFCHSGDNEDKLLLCDGCDRGYHTYCFRPKMENIPDGDWYCHECMNKATGERNCLVCGKRVGKNLVLCELCPRAYHTDCHNPVMPKIPRGKWYCSNCHSKQPKKRNSTRRSHSKGGGGGNSGGGGGGATAAATAAAAAAATGNASGGGASVGNNGSGSGAAPGGGSSGGAGGGSGNGSNAGGGGATSGGGSVTRDSESSDHPPASPTPSTASNTHVEEVSSSEPPTPTASPRKEASGASVVVGSTSGSGASGGGPGGAGSGNSNAGATSSTGTTTSGSGNSTGTGSTASSATGSGSASKTLTKKQQRELAPCKLLLEQLEQQDEAWPFLLPVNTKQFPTYKKIIKTPMDLSTIKKRLQDNVYKTRDEFCADVRQMFINCEVFNEDDSPVGKAGHGMRSFFEMRWTEITGSPPPPPPTHS
ncbi:bromodomain adjacent to zinc finger domain protein 2B isoform X2 [Venturia canescens]|uniref:bromodomain adjacent to zinc finger domain protein 2B isoform X2 n=1 Tax=Venturia canescens TaxID=32260 RepID=UPI001C9C884A|nr:bromodomain adjacent to zinc finger domain protein 2B-like isoform X2 [Venturia canescens]